MKADRKAYQDQKQVQKLGNQRGDGSTGNAHSGGTQLSEDDQIVQPGVRRYRAKTCPKGDSGVFLAAQPCGQDGADRHGQIRERLGVLLRTQKLCDQNAGIAGGAVPQGFKAADGSPCPERRILMNGGQSGNAFPACQCIIKANDLHILRDADALSLQKSHKFQRKGAAETVYPLLVHYTVFYQYILPLYAVTWVAFSFTELIASISSLPVLPSNRRVNRMGWSKGGFINTALLST